MCVSVIVPVSDVSVSCIVCSDGSPVLLLNPYTFLVVVVSLVPARSRSCSSVKLLVVSSVASLVCSSVKSSVLVSVASLVCSSVKSSVLVLSSVTSSVLARSLVINSCVVPSLFQMGLYSY